MAKEQSGKLEVQNVMITLEQFQDLKEVFESIDTDESGYIDMAEIGTALNHIGMRLAQFEVRDLIRTKMTVTGDKLNFEQFKLLYAILLDKYDVGHKFKNFVLSREGLDNYGGMSSGSTEGTTHTVRREEQIAFSNWINRKLNNDEDCKKYMPLDIQSGDLYRKCKDGIIICKLINCSQPNTIDERAINKDNPNLYQMHENLTLALNSARAIGCNVVNIGPEDIESGRPHLVLGLLWQIIRIGLLSDINLYENPNLIELVPVGEDFKEFANLSPEEILIRWVNYHLEKAECGRTMTNFSNDVRDSVIYAHLLQQIAPHSYGITIDYLQEKDLRKRSELMLREAAKINCRNFVEADDVVNGNQKLNMAFVANLFNNFPSMQHTNGVAVLDMVDGAFLVEETREERMYRNWMNSMGVTPTVNHLYYDLRSGLIIFQIYDVIKPGVVDWTRVHQKFHHLRLMMEQIENCNYVVQLGLTSRFSLVGIDGKDLYDGNPTLTLAVVWQLMKAYNFSILSKLAGNSQPISEKEIVAWANKTLQDGGKSRTVAGFNDPNLSNSKAILDLVDVIRPGSVDFKVVKECLNDQDRLETAKYAISTCRKIGARVYALPEHIAEVNPKMLLTLFACLMITHLENKK